MAGPSGRKPAIDLMIAGSVPEVAAIQRFRYQVAVEELGGTSVDADAARKVVTDPLDADAQHLFARDIRGKLAAALRIVPAAIDAVPVAMADAFRLGDFARFGRPATALQDRLAIIGDLSGGGVLAALLGGAVRLARRLGARFLCTAVLPDHVRSFEQLGYRRYAEAFIDRDDRYLVPLVLLTEDYIHLATINSPFAPLIVRENNPSTTAEWFTRHYKGTARTVVAPGTDADQLWEHLTQMLRQSPMQGIPLLRDLTYADARRFIGVGSVMRGRAGDVLVRRGDMGREMFVAIAGEFEARLAGKAGEALSVAHFERGDVFGEIAYLSEAPRTADVTAMAEGEVLVLTQQSMQRAIAEMPQVAARVLFNLSLVLCERLGTTTARLI
jgi:hypothetical protein